MGHIALYRAWRPQSFQDMVGQQHITQTLQNSLQEQRFSHAYLFGGPRGTGKTTAARILAKAVNCGQGPNPEPCNVCEACKRIAIGATMDIVEIDAASNRGVEDIRDLCEKVKYAPIEVRYKVYIIDEVHMLTTEAFNALLKTLEEPPVHVMFILATTELQRLPATIISRCQCFDFRRVPLSEQVQRLEQVCQKEGIQANKDSLTYIAKLSDGGMRDAISLLDQMTSFTDGPVTYQQVLDITGGIPEERFAELAMAIQAGDVGTMLSLIGQLIQEGKGADKCIENLLYFFRDLLIMKVVPDGEALSGRLVRIEPFCELAREFSENRLFQIIDTLNRYQADMKFAIQPQILLEVALLQLTTQSQRAAHSTTCTGDFLQTNAMDDSLNGLKHSSTVQHLCKQIASLEVKMEQLLKSSGKVGLLQEQGTQACLSKYPLQFEKYIANCSSAEFEYIRRTWEQVLQRVKEAGVNIHAWLVNGEPLSCFEDRILIGFKNSIHRETTGKPANKQIIERVLHETFNKSYRIETMMFKDWEIAVTQADGKEEQVFQLKPEGDKGQGPQKLWIKEAIQIFGEDLVVIKD